MRHRRLTRRPSHLPFGFALLRERLRALQRVLGPLQHEGEQRRSLIRHRAPGSGCGDDRVLAIMWSPRSADGGVVDTPGRAGALTRPRRVVRGYAGPSSCPCSTRSSSCPGSGPGSSPTGESRSGDGKTQQDTVPGAGLAAVLLVLDMVHIARRRGLAAPAGPPALAVPQDHCVADARGDGLGVPDVQRKARPAEADAELPAAQERGQPAGAGQQVHGLADDRLLQGLQARVVPGRARPRRCRPYRGAGACRTARIAGSSRPGRPGSRPR